MKFQMRKFTTVLVGNIKKLKFKPELGTLEWWISGLIINPLFFLISRLNIACSPLIFNLQINYPIRIKDIPF